MIELYLSYLTAPMNGSFSLVVSTITRHLTGLAWDIGQIRFSLDRKTWHTANVLAGVKRKHARPPVQREAILPKDFLAMIATLPFDLAFAIVPSC